MDTLVIEASCGRKGCDAAEGAELDKYGNPLHPAFCSAVLMMLSSTLC